MQYKINSNIENINKPIIDKINKFFDSEFKKHDYLEEVSLYYVQRNIIDWLKYGELK